MSSPQISEPNTKPVVPPKKNPIPPPIRMAKIVGPRISLTQVNCTRLGSWSSDVDLLPELGKLSSCDWPQWGHTVALLSNPLPHDLHGFIGVTYSDIPGGEPQSLRQKLVSAKSITILPSRFLTGHRLANNLASLMSKRVRRASQAAVYETPASARVGPAGRDLPSGTRAARQAGR